MQKLFVLFIYLFSSQLHAQYGGTGIYSVLKQPVSARMAAWGGFCNSYGDRDIGLSAINPALLNASMENRAAMNFNTQVTGVWSGNASFGLPMGKYGTGGIHISFMDYGKFDAYDAGGNYEGEIVANETAVTFGMARELKKGWTAGLNLKYIYSILGPYISSGVAVDAGAAWQSDDSLITAGFTLRNLGFAALNYVRGNAERLPLSAEAGITFKPRHMPFRFNVVAHSLQKPDLTYSQYLESNTIDLTGQAAAAQPAGFGEKVFRHLTFGTELVLGKNFGIMGGYNHQRRKEMGSEIRPGVAGYSWGIHFKVNRFQIAYSSMSLFRGFNTNLFTFSALISDFKRK